MTHFISTTLPYVNGDPHIGHAQEFVLADVLARFYPDVHFHSGADENSLKNLVAAQQAGVEVADYVARQSDRFSDLQKQLGLQIDDFIRTSLDPRHRPTVEAIWHACQQRGDLFQREYQGLYCVGCEQFYTEDELIDGCCREHNAPLEEVSELNYFFRLSRYREPLIRLIEQGDLRIEPEAKRNEVLGFLQQNVDDISVSRSAERSGGWGIPVPDDPSQVIYVWIDALTNYASAPGLDGWQAYDRVTHVVGKGVLRFHAVYWPALLLSAGLRLPTEILVHNYVTVEGQKIGKSLGNAVDPLDPVATVGLDAFRYYLIRHIGCFRDGDFSTARLFEVYEKELANQLGNLVARLAKLLQQTPVGPATPVESVPDIDLDGLAEVLKIYVDQFALHKALSRIWQDVEAVNAYLGQEQPWRLEGEARLICLASAQQVLLNIATALTPFLPTTAQRIPSLLSGLEQGQLFPRLTQE